MKKTRYILLFAFCLLSLFMTAQQETLVYLEHCDFLSFDEEQHPDAQLLKGNVQFRHEDALMFCDSAYFYEKSNSLDAFGNVRFVQGDTLFGYGDVLYYDGNTKFARLRNHVKLVHINTILTTEQLNYDRKQDLAYYFTGGTIEDEVNTLTSIWGQYTPPNKQAVFKTNVRLTNENFTLTADTLKYNTESNIADLVGPTEIVYQGETTIFSTLGWYNTKTEESKLLQDAKIVHTEGKTLTGDTIFYNKAIGYGRVVNNMVMTDSVRKLTLTGNYGEMYEDGKRGYATDSALFTDWSGEDYIYMHADSLFTEEVPYRIYSLIERDSVLIDSILTYQAPDTLWQDTTYQQARAFYGVRVFKSDMQAVCDSLVYNFRDSVVTLFGKPICWNNDNQVSADLINIYMKDSTVDYAHGIGAAIAIKQESFTQFDQLSGKEIFAYIRDGEMKQIDVNGNAETVFYPREDDGSIIGVNKTQSSYVKIYLEDQKIHHIVFTAATSGNMYPLDSISPGDQRLGNFFWAEQERPMVPGDVFARPQRANRPKTEGLSAIDNEKKDATEEPTTNKRRNRRNNRNNNNKKQ